MDCIYRNHKASQNLHSNLSSHLYLLSRVFCVQLGRTCIKTGEEIGTTANFGHW